MKRRDPRHDVKVIERNQPYDTFGWGVVFSDQVVAAIERADPESAAEIADAFNHWNDVELVFKSERLRTTGHGFIGIGRKRLLNILQRRCERLGVKLAFEQEVESDLEFSDADLIIAVDGVNSRIRERYKGVFKPDVLVRPNRYIWLGTLKPFDAFTFDFRRTEHGWFQAHIYKFDPQTSTFIVETTEETFREHGLDALDQDRSIAFCEKLFAETLGGAKLMTNARHQRGSAWLNFNRLVCERWTHYNGRAHIVLMGDAAHTAHFAIGSGTKLALDDAIELADQFDRLGHGVESIPAVLDAYEQSRRVGVAREQNAGRNAMEWFEVVGRRYTETLEPKQFFYSMLTRSQRISHENVRLRDPVGLAEYEQWLAERAGVAVAPGSKPPHRC
jgi:anthraniloyl-CoA monooxygenase